MATLQIKDVPRGMRIIDRHRHISGTVTSVGEDRLRVRLDDGRRRDVVADEYGKVRWASDRRRSRL